MNPTMFIGSSVEGLPVARALRQCLQHDFSVQLWCDDHFKLSTLNVDDLIAVLDRYDCGAFVFSPDDTLKIRKETHKAARDNVLFELGLFMGRHGKDRVFLLVPADDAPRLPTDLLGITPLRYEPDKEGQRVTPVQNVRSAADHITASLDRSPPRMAAQSRGKIVPRAAMPFQTTSRALEVLASATEVELVGTGLSDFAHQLSHAEVRDLVKGRILAGDLQLTIVAMDLKNEPYLKTRGEEIDHSAFQVRPNLAAKLDVYRSLASELLDSMPATPGAAARRGGFSLRTHVAIPRAAILRFDETLYVRGYTGVTRGGDAAFGIRLDPGDLGYDIYLREAARILSVSVEVEA